MALLKGKIDFTGKLGDLSAYRMKGIERTVVRAKGGPSAEQIKNDPEFQNVRHNNDEFGGRAKAMSMMTVLLLPQKPLADFNYSNDISSMLKKVQELDTESLWGQRQIEFTKAPALWEGFSMNRKTNFETFARVPIACSLSRETLSAQIDIPALIPGVTLNAPSWRPLYCIQAALGVLPDYLYIPGRKYEPTIPRNEIAAYRLSTDWAASSAGSDAASLQISIPHLVPGTRAFSLMLSIGIRFGTPGVAERWNRWKTRGRRRYSRWFDFRFQISNT